MSQQALDLRRSLQTVRRYRTLVGLVAALGLAAGAVYTVLSPPMLSSKALVVLSPETRDVGTQLVIASSDSVLKRAMRSADPAVSIATLRGRVHVSSLTSNLIAISAQGKTAAQAEDTANAVAASYISYTSSPNSPAGRVLGRVLQTATTATGMSLPESLLITGGIGALVGALIGAIVALAIGRNDRRLRERDEMASAIGVPVLASIPVGHPSDVAGWTKLLGGYEPGVVHAWSMRKALHHLGLTDLSGGHGASLAVLSLSSDTGALALGPHLAVFAASLGIPTELVISPQHDTNAAATLFAACTVMSTSSRRSSHLSIIAGNHENTDRHSGAGLTIVVAVVDGRNPRVADTVRATTTVLGVSAAAATAEQLARVAVSAAGDGREIAGIIVADPDSLDHTTGRIPQPARPAQRRQPTRLAGGTTETRR